MVNASHGPLGGHIDARATAGTRAGFPTGPGDAARREIGWPWGIDGNGFMAVLPPVLQDQIQDVWEKMGVP